MRLLVNAQVSLFAEQQHGGNNPTLEKAAQHLDDALAALDAARQPLDVRLPAPEDWQAA